MSDHVYDDKFMEVMGRTVGDTEFKTLEVYLIGEALLTWLSGTVLLGHKQPGNTLDYSHPSPGDSLYEQIVRDVIVWTSGRAKFAPDADARITQMIHDSNWLRNRLNHVSEAVVPEVTKDERPAA